MAASLKRETILSHIKGDFTPEVEIFDLLPSTNTYAKSIAREEKDKNRTPRVIIAREQSGGRGRLGRSFSSALDCGLYMSLLFYPDSQNLTPAKITAGAAVAVSRTISSLYGICPRVKWVNDIMLGDLKLGGILAEGEFNPSGGLAYAVLGIGINLRKDGIAGDLSKIATSLDCHVKITPDVNLLAAGIIDALGEILNSPDFIDSYRKLCYVIGKEVTVIRGNESYSARVIDVDDEANLIVSTPEGKIKKLYSGEISIRPKLSDL